MAKGFLSVAGRPAPKKKINRTVSGNLATQEEKDDDWMFKPYGLSKATRIDRSQEYTKIEGEI